jgi:hypothetical protein
MKFFTKIVALILCFSVVAYAQGNTFNKVRYNGGSISTKVNPDDWDNKLTVSSDAIVFALKDGQSVAIPPKRVNSLSYGQEAHRRVGTAVGLAIISLGVGALFALHKTKLHYIGVNYTDNDGKAQGLLLQGDKSNFRAILVALQGVTGAPVSVSEKERSEIPAGIVANTTKEPEQKQNASVATTAMTPSQEQPETVQVTSAPDSAEVYVDTAFVGNAPATIKLSPGKHTVRLTLTGFKDWSREIAAQPGVDAHLNATLEKVN